MSRATLKEIGLQLDKDIFPRVKNGGIVTPDNTAVCISPWAEEKKDEKQGKSRPATRPWSGTTGGQRQTNRQRTSGSTPPTVCTEFHAQYEGELTAVREAYPGAKVWLQREGLWLLTESILLPGLWQKATFLTGIPFDRFRIVRSWGFWMGMPSLYPTWIGPRHTNMPDGSICAFEPTDGTWKLGDSLIILLDLYTLWALRHLHLQVFERWPGRQVAHYVHERLTEIKPTEYCGCGSNNKYSSCCRDTDLRSDRSMEAVKFFCDGGVRLPPKAVTTFIQLQEHPPNITDLLPIERLLPVFL
jgi:hypothetical protein